MQDGFRHEALPYGGREGFVGSCAALANDALAHDERIVFLAESDKLDDVRAAVGPVPGEISYVATDEHGRNPSRLMTMLESFQAAGAPRRSLGVNESVFAARSRAALLEAQLADCAWNAPALRHWPLSVVCLYDSHALDDDSMSVMRRSHPVIRGQAENGDYDPTLGESLFSGGLAAPPGDFASLNVDGSDLATMREFVRGQAGDVDISPDRAEDLVLAANEIVSNSLRHGGGDCTMRIWVEGDSIACEVRDSGRIADPLAGRLAPPVDATAGRGLWLANHLCDLVQIRSSVEGTVVRLFMDRL